MKNYIKEILFLIGDQVRVLPVMMIFFVSVSLLDLIGIGLIGPYVGLIFDSGPMNGQVLDLVRFIGLPVERDLLLPAFGIVLLIVFSLKAVVGIWINYKIVSFAQYQQVSLRSYLMKSYQSLPYDEYINRNSSEYVHSIQGMVLQFSGQVLIPLLKSISDGLIVFVVFVFLAWVNGIAVLLLLGLVFGFVVIYDLLLKKKIRKYGEEANESAQYMLQGVHEGVDGFKEIRILGKEDYFYNKVLKGAEKYSQLNALVNVYTSIPKYLMEVILVGFVVLLVMITVFLERSAHDLLPTLAMFGVASLRIVPAANLFASNVVQLRFGRDAVKRLVKDVKKLGRFNGISISCLSSGDREGEAFEEFCLKDVGFLYSKNNVLEDINLSFRAGESIGIIGSSGSGKTTLVDLMLGLLDPSAGEIKYNNEQLTKDNIGVWRQQIAYLPQQIFMVDDTLRCNIALGENEVDEARLDDVLRQTCLKDFVDQSPDGINTIIGEKGVRLSGGQRQRVVLARALYHGRDVLVMDESTSALDTETEKVIVEEIRRFHGKKTLIVIAHRLSTVQYCDRVYRLDSGKIVDVGSPGDILNAN